jgi:AbrB family looped-hinge helix DNA binding protein
MNSLSGFINRVDDLGRVVIPKEIRRVLKIHTGDKLEISLNSEDKIVINKYKEPELKDKLIEAFADWDITEQQKFLNELKEIYTESFY